MQEHFQDLDFIKSRFNYNASNGILSWKPNPDYPSWWNTRYAFTSPTAKDKLGYTRAKITRVVDGVSRSSYVSCHRICYFIHHGWIPECIDHINGDVSDNRIVNLRASDFKTNTWNRAPNKGTITGYKGVHVIRQRDGVEICGYAAKLGHNGVREYLGFFSTAEDARDAVINRERELRDEWRRK